MAAIWSVVTKPFSPGAGRRPAPSADPECCMPRSSWRRPIRTPLCQLRASSPTRGGADEPGDGNRGDPFASGPRRSVRRVDLGRRPYPGPGDDSPLAKDRARLTLEVTDQTRTILLDQARGGRSQSSSGVRSTVTAQMANARAISPQARASITGDGKTTKAKT
jgi:hypothetical protein